jgi:hypothetical protein
MTGRISAEAYFNQPTLTVAENYFSSGGTLDGLVVYVKQRMAENVFTSNQPLRKYYQQRLEESVTYWKNNIQPRQKNVLGAIWTTIFGTSDTDQTCKEITQLRQLLTNNEGTGVAVSVLLDRRKTLARLVHDVEATIFTCSLLKPECNICVADVTKFFQNYPSYRKAFRATLYERVHQEHTALYSTVWGVVHRTLSSYVRTTVNQEQFLQQALHLLRMIDTVHAPLPDVRDIRLQENLDLSYRPYLTLEELRRYLDSCVDGDIRLSLKELQRRDRRDIRLKTLNLRGCFQFSREQIQSVVSESTITIIYPDDKSDDEGFVLVNSFSSGPAQTDISFSSE